MMDNIEHILELLETAVLDRDWELVLEAIRLLDELPDGYSLYNFDDELYNFDDELDEY